MTLRSMFAVAVVLALAPTLAAGAVRDRKDGPATLRGAQATAPVSRPAATEADLTPEQRFAIETRLATLGLLRGRPDGRLGPAARRAVRLYQDGLGIAATGILGALEIEALLRGARANAAPLPAAPAAVRPMLPPPIVPPAVVPAAAARPESATVEERAARAVAPALVLAAAAAAPLPVIARADVSCEDAKPRLEADRRALDLTMAGDADLRAGSTVRLAWSLPGSASATQTYLVIAADGPIQIAGKGVYAFAPGAAAPFGLRAFAAQTRIVVPLHAIAGERRGTIDLRPLAAGPLHLAAAVTGFARCGELADPAPRAATLPIGPAVAALPEADFAQTLPSPDGSRRIETSGTGWRLVDAASGAVIAERTGLAPRFSATGRYVAALAAGGYEIVEANSGALVQTVPAGGEDIGWARNDRAIVLGTPGRGEADLAAP